MLRPSYTDLLNVMSQTNDDVTIASRYTIVIAAAKRARQLVDHAEPLTDKIKVDKPVSIAVNELYEGKIRVRAGKTEEECQQEEEQLLAEEMTEENQAEEEA